MTTTHILDRIDILDLSIAAGVLAIAQRKDFKAAKLLSRFAGATTKFAKDASTVNKEKFTAAWQNLPPDLQRALIAEFERQSGVDAFADRVPLLPAP
jgi:hypothetical protein